MWKRTVDTRDPWRTALAGIAAAAVSFWLVEGSAFAQGAGPDGAHRFVDLTAVEGAGFDGASGKVNISSTWADSHPYYPGFPPVFKFSVNQLRCLEGDVYTPTRGRVFYAIYLTTETRPRTRIHSFNTSCWPEHKHQSQTTLPDYDDETLQTERVVIEITLEHDDGTDETYVVMKGEDDP